VVTNILEEPDASTLIFNPEDGWSSAFETLVTTCKTTELHSQGDDNLSFYYTENLRSHTGSFHLQDQQVIDVELSWHAI
jgi:hypothetical protein